MDVDPASNRPDSGSGEDTEYQMSSDDSDQEINIVDVDEEKNEDVAESLNSSVSMQSNVSTNEQSVPTSSTINNSRSHIAPCVFETDPGVTDLVSFQQVDVNEKKNEDVAESLNRSISIQNNVPSSEQQPVPTSSTINNSLSHIAPCVIEDSPAVTGSGSFQQSLEYSALASLTQMVERFEGTQEHEIIQVTQASTISLPRDLPATNSSLSNQVGVNEENSEDLDKSVSMQSNVPTNKQSVLTSSTVGNSRSYIAPCVIEASPTVTGLVSFQQPPEYCVLASPRQMVVRFQGAQQHENIQNSQASTSLLPRNLCATQSSLNSQPFSFYLDVLTQRARQLQQKQQREIFQHTQPYTSLSPNYLALEWPRLTVESFQREELQGQNFHAMQLSTSLPPRELFPMTKAWFSLKNQGHLQKSFDHHIPENLHLRTDQPDYILPKRHSSSKVAAYTNVALEASQQHMRQRSHHQQLHSQPAVPPFPPPLRHSSMPMQNHPQPLTIPQKRAASSRKSLVLEPAASEPKQQLTLEDIETLMCNIEKKKIKLHISQDAFNRTVFKDSSKYISRRSMTVFRNFNVLFSNMCHLKPLLESVLEDIETSVITNYLELNPSVHNPEPTVLSQHMSSGIHMTKPHESENSFLQIPKPASEEINMLNFDSGIDSNVSNDRPDITTDEDTDDRMSHESSDDSDKEIDIIGDDDDKHPVVCVNSKVWGNSKPKLNRQAVPTGNSHSRKMAPSSKDMETVIADLFSASLTEFWSLRQSKPQQVSLEEMQRFVGTFSRKREKLNITQIRVCEELSKILKRRIQRQWLTYFENFNKYYKQLCELKPLVEKWLEDAHM